MLKRSTQRVLLGVGTLAIGLGGLGSLGGCSTTAENSRLGDSNKVLTARNQELQAALDDCRRTASALSGSGDVRSTTITTLQSRNNELQRLVDAQAATISEFDGRIAGLGFSPLDATTDRRLQQLAAQNPNLVTYDAQRGMLQFASDLTFDSGSDVVKASAQQSLAALASVLKGGAGASYEIRVVGHTDNMRIGSGTARRHPTNMHLSAHRAIAVRRALVSMGVPAAKIQAAGWGEFRPSVANNASSGTAQNRRVEIFLVADTGSANAPAPAGSGGASGGMVDVNRSAPNRQPDPTK